MTNIPRTLRYGAVVLSLLVAGCGGSSATTTRAHAHRAATPASSAVPAPATFTFRHLYSLPAPLRDPAFAAIAGSRFVLVGGLSAADTSTSEIDVASLSRVTASGSLPGAQHDAQAAGLPDGAYVFGGANFSQYDHIYKVDPAGPSVKTTGTLPALSSDVGVTQSGATAYIVGGYDGSAALNTIVAWTRTRGARVVGRLPVALRYAAVTTTASGQLLVIGGTTPSGSASAAVYRFDPATHHVREIARLPHPVTHAGAATLGAYAYLVGGRSELASGQTAAIWSIDPASGRIRRAGRLPAPTSDAAVLRVGGAIIIAGGMTPRGTTLAEVGELIPAP